MKLNKYEMDFHNTINEFIDIADGGNSLSEIILQNIDFKTGCFYTLLPNVANFEHLYKISLGGILPQNPVIYDITDKSKSTYSYTPNINNEVSEFIGYYLQNGCSCIMDDVTVSVTDSFMYKTRSHLEKYVHYINNEILYLLNCKKVPLELIIEILSNSQAIWHSLGILTKHKIAFSKKNITRDELKKICEDVLIVFINAYDGEGYVFWEKTTSK